MIILVSLHPTPLRLLPVFGQLTKNRIFSIALVGEDTLGQARPIYRVVCVINRVD